MGIAGTDRARADLALLFCTAVWGTTFVVVKDALAHASVFVFLALRFTLAAALLAGPSRAALVREGRPALRAGAALGVLLFAGYAFQTLGLQRTSASNAGLITGAGVVLVPLMQGLLFRRRIGAWSWSGAVVALVGIYFLTIPAGGGVGALRAGDALVGACAVAFALHVLYVGRFRAGHSTRALNAVQVTVTAALAAAFVPAAHLAGLERARLSLTPGLAAALAVTAVGATALAFTLQVWAQRHTTPTRAAILFSMEPVFAVATSAWLLGERLGVRALLGGSLVLAGIVISEIKGPGPIAPESAGASAS
jgi:drug/metabolite transporter (DMT)-like permease